MGGSLHKPAGQTLVSAGGILLLLPDSSSVTKVPASHLLLITFNSGNQLPGLGSSTANQLATGGIFTLGQLRNANLEEVMVTGCENCLL